jgi:hypothetical protein
MAIAYRHHAAYGSSAESTSHDFPYPTVQAGDVIILAVSNTIAAAQPTTPSGFTLDTTINPIGVSRNFATYHKVATGSESGNLSVSWGSTSVVAQGGMVAYSGVDTGTPLDIAAVSENHAVNATSHDAIPVTPVSDNTLIVYPFACGATGTTWNAATGERFEAIASSGITRSVLYVDEAGPAAGVQTSTYTATPSALAGAVVATLVLRPAADELASETLRPTAVSLTNFTGSHTDIDADPNTTPVTDAGLTPVVDP